MDPQSPALKFQDFDEQLLKPFLTNTNNGIFLCKLFLHLPGGV